MNTPDPVGIFTQNSIKPISQKYCLESRGFGARNDKGQRGLNYSFSHPDIPTISEARSLILHLREDVLLAIKNDNNFYPIVKEYINSPKLLLIGVVFGNRDQLIEGVAMALLTNGKIFYSSYDPKIPRGYVDLYEETLEEALEKVRLNNKEKASKAGTALEWHSFLPGTGETSLSNSSHESDLNAKIAETQRKQKTILTGSLLKERQDRKDILCCKMQRRVR